MKTSIGTTVSILLAAAKNHVAISTTVDEVSQAQVSRERLLQVAPDTSPVVGIAVGSVRPIASSSSIGKDISSESDVETELVAALEMGGQATGECIPSTTVTWSAVRV